MYYRARYFDPATGEFASQDPLGYVDGMSRYSAYFAPNAVDPSGTIRQKIQDKELIEKIRKALKKSGLPAIGTGHMDSASGKWIKGFWVRHKRKTAGFDCDDSAYVSYHCLLRTFDKDATIRKSIF